MARMVLGVFTNRQQAENAILTLDQKDYNVHDISIVMKDRSIIKTEGNDVASGALSGAVTGGVLGAFAGLLIASGVIPPLGVLLFGGPIATVLGLSGAAATTAAGAASGAMTGGLIGALVNWGLPENEAREYEQSISRGGILVAVPTRLWEEQEVMTVMEDFGADQIRIIGMGEYFGEDEKEKDFAPAYFSEIDMEMVGIEKPTRKTKRIKKKK